MARRGLRSILKSETGYDVAGEAKDAREAIAKARELNPDVVVMDISMPNLNGLEATLGILTYMPNPRVIVLTICSSEQVIHEVLEAAARFPPEVECGPRPAAGGRSPDETPDVLQVRRRRHRPGRIPGSKARRQKTRAATRENLTAREREILQLLAEARPTKLVAAELGISVRTAETHRAHIMHKLHLESFSVLLRDAVRNKIIYA